MTTKNCRTCKCDVDIALFAKNPGRESLRLDCNPCRSINDYNKVVAKRAAARIYIPKDKRTSEVSDPKLYNRYY